MAFCVLLLVTIGPAGVGVNWLVVGVGGDLVTLLPLMVSFKSAPVAFGLEICTPTVVCLLVSPNLDFVTSPNSPSA